MVTLAHGKRISKISRVMFLFGFKKDDPFFLPSLDNQYLSVSRCQKQSKNVGIHG